MPSARAVSWSRSDAGATRSRTPLATRLPRSTRAAIRRSASFAPVQAPMYAVSMRTSPYSSTARLFAGLWGAATCGASAPASKR